MTKAMALLCNTEAHTGIYFLTRKPYVEIIFLEIKTQRLKECLSLHCKLSKVNAKKLLNFSSTIVTEIL